MEEQKENVPIERRHAALKRIFANAEFALINSDERKNLKHIIKIVAYDHKKFMESTFSVPNSGGEKIDGYWSRLYGCIVSLYKSDPSSYKYAVSELKNLSAEVNAEYKMVSAAYGIHKAESDIIKETTVITDAAKAGIKKLADKIESGVDKIKQQLCQQDSNDPE